MIRKYIGIAIFAVVLALTVLAYFRSQLPVALVRPNVGENLSLLLTDKLEKANLPIKTLPIEVENGIIASISGVTVLFPKTADYTTAVRALQVIWQGATIEIKKPKEIDLRFSNPVVRY